MEEQLTGMQTTCHNTFFTSSPEPHAKSNPSSVPLPWEEYIHRSIGGGSHRHFTSGISMVISFWRSRFLALEELVQDMS